MLIHEVKINVDANLQDKFRVLKGGSWGEFASGEIIVRCYNVPSGLPTLLYGFRIMRHDESPRATD